MSITCIALTKRTQGGVEVVEAKAGKASASLLMAFVDEDDEMLKRNAISSVGLEKDKPSSPGQSDSYLSESRFDQCAVSPLSLKGIKDAGYEKMNVVQEATLPIILKEFSQNRYMKLLLDGSWVSASVMAVYMLNHWVLLVLSMFDGRSFYQG